MYPNATWPATTMTYLRLLFLGPVEYVLCGEHGQNGEDFITAAQVH
jgi:hypothetical protein